MSEQSKKPEPSGSDLNDAERSVFEAGYYAGVMAMDAGVYSAGFAIQACPHRAGTPMWSIWNRGWKYAGC